MKRYDFILDPMTSCYCDLVEDKDGEYVAYSDHQKENAELRELLREGLIFLNLFCDVVGKESLVGRQAERYAKRVQEKINE